MKKNKTKKSKLEDKKPVLVPVSVLLRMKKYGAENEKFLYEIVAEGFDLLQLQGNKKGK